MTVAAPVRPHAVGRRQRRVAPPVRSAARAAQRDQVAHEVQRRAGVVALGGDVVRLGVAERQPRLDARLGEAGARLGAPVHRRAADVAVAAGIAGAVRHRVERVGGIERHVRQPDLVAVVEERRAAQRRAASAARAASARGRPRPARRQPPGVVVGAGLDRPRAAGSCASIPSTIVRIGSASSAACTNRKLNARLSSSSPPVERDQLLEVEHVGLADEDRRRLGSVATVRQRRSTSWTSGRLNEYFCWCPRPGSADGRRASPPGRRAARGR